MRDSQKLENLSGFRLQLALGERSARIWALRSKGRTLAEIAGEFGISKQRVQQVARAAQDRLDAWPEPTIWQASLPVYLRELAIARAIATRADLVRCVTDSAPSWRSWSKSDVAAAKAYLGEIPPVAETVDLIEYVLSVMRGIVPDLRRLSAGDVIGAETMLVGFDAMQAHGRDAFVSAARDPMLAILPTPNEER